MSDFPEELPDPFIPLGGEPEQELAPSESEPKEEGFTIRVSSYVRMGDRKLMVSGRLAIFVRPGAQYATWRQFPSTIEFHLVSAPEGACREFANWEMSISDSMETYENYAQMPSDCIVAQDFCMDLLMHYPKNFAMPGRYELEASYFGLKAKPVSFVLE